MVAEPLPSDCKVNVPLVFFIDADVPFGLITDVDPSRKVPVLVMFDADPVRLMVHALLDVPAKKTPELLMVPLLLPPTIVIDEPPFMVNVPEFIRELLPLKVMVELTQVKLPVVAPLF